MPRAALPLLASGCFVLFVSAQVHTGSLMATSREGSAVPPHTTQQYAMTSSVADTVAEDKSTLLEGFRARNLQEAESEVPHRAVSTTEELVVRSPASTGGSYEPQWCTARVSSSSSCLLYCKGFLFELPFS